MKQSFSKLVLHGARLNNKLVRTIYERRGFQFGQQMQRIFRRHK
jgi:hypothetical protein